MLVPVPSRINVRPRQGAHRCQAPHRSRMQTFPQPRGRRLRAQAQSYSESDVTPLFTSGQPASLPGKSGVYAVLDASNILQFVGISRNVGVSINAHYNNLGGDVVHSVKVGVIDNATKDDLTKAWKDWLQAGVDEGGSIPPGNAGPQKEQWQGKPKVAVKPEIKLTAGKGSEDLTCDIQDLIAMVVKNEHVVAFIKGTRTQPQCGFSYGMLETLNGTKADFQVVNVLDDQYNPGLREGIKDFSAWPTIPQLYVGGEFVGGSDIVQDLARSGELAVLVRKHGADQ